jgi:cytochrome P450
LELQSDLDELALSIVAATLFSSNLGRSAVNEIERSLPIVLRGVISHTLAPDAIQKLLIPGNRRLTQANARIRRVIDDVIRAYRADGTDRGDLLSMLLTVRDADTGQGMTDLQLRDELVTVMLAGAETTASALGSVFFELGRHKNVQDRVAAELASVLTGPALSYDTRRLEYTQRVLAEALRLHVPAWILTRRTTSPVTLGSTRLPEAAELLFSLPALHRDPTLYPDPLTFDPDRWLRRPASDMPRGAYLPFGEGNRQCIGNTFAWIEMIAIAAAILARWELTPDPQAHSRRLFRGVSRLDRVTMTVTPRAMS